MGAELRAIKQGLIILVDRNYQKLIVESDSEMVLDILKHNNNAHLACIVDECRYLMNKLQLVTLQHIYQEGNKIADYLTGMGRQAQLQSTLLLDTPPQLLLLQDNGPLVFEHWVKVHNLRKSFCCDWQRSYILLFWFLLSWAFDPVDFISFWLNTQPKWVKLLYLY